MAPAEPLTLFDPEPPTTPAPPNRLLQVRRIYAEPAALDSSRGRQVLGRFPGAEVVEGSSRGRSLTCAATRAMSSAGCG